MGKLTPFSTTTLIELTDDDNEKVLVNFNQILLIRTTWDNQSEILLHMDLRVKVKETMEEIAGKIKDTLLFKLETYQ